PDRLFDVFDVDHHDLDEWQRLTGFRLPPTWRWQTGSGNWQLAFLTVPGLTNRVKKIPFADVRSKGGLAILPSSRNRNGQYRWATPPGAVPLAPWPEDLLAALMPPKMSSVAMAPR